MSQSLLNAWSSPAPSPITGASISTNPFVASLSPTQTENPIPEKSDAQASLLDDDDLQGHEGGLGVVMKPHTISPSTSIQNKNDDDDDDDWNW